LHSLVSASQVCLPAPAVQREISHTPLNFLYVTVRSFVAVLRQFSPNATPDAAACASRLAQANKFGMAEEAAFG
jgi:hypothetical protein